MIKKFEDYTPTDIDKDVTTSAAPQPKVVISEIRMSYEEIQELAFEAHQRKNHKDLPAFTEGSPIKEIKADDGHVIKIFLED